ncbi:prepilin-type N-terminal cleavage/methylation domain-containing protein [Patescibacteria group bacterium]|nr:prepilin-type N-terminal cleavage/methylation domain-containing protein [Patescibacteria group bacterium]
MFPTNKKSNQSGFTILETVLALAIVALVFLSLGSLVTSILRSSHDMNLTLLSHDQSRLALNKLTTELRRASVSSLGSYPIAQATDQSLTFYANLDSTSDKEKITYFSDGTTLKRSVTKPSGTPLNYQTGNTITDELVYNLTNATTIFSYYNNDYNGQSAPLSTPVNLNDVRLIKITLIVDATPNQLPLPYTLSTQVNLRNLKDNL